VSGRGAPVVLGNVIGSPRRLRTARLALRQHPQQRRIARANAGDDPNCGRARQMRLKLRLLHAARGALH